MIRKKAFLVGINYKGTNSQLSGCINDVLEVKDLLVSHYGYRHEDILLMTDDTVYKPTKQNLLDGLAWLLNGATATLFKRQVTPLPPGSTLVFYYSGHGSGTVDVSGDEADKQDEVLVPLDYQTKGFITDDYLRSNFCLKLPNGVSCTAIVDACQSGTVFDLRWGTEFKLGTAIEPFTDDLTLYQQQKIPETAAKVVTLSGCLDNQYSYDAWMSGKANGALSRALFDALKELNWRPSYEKLLDAIYRKLKARGMLRDQVPCFSFGRSIGLSEAFSF